MKITMAWAIVNSAMWLGVTAGVVTALVTTQRLSVMWFYLIPALCYLSLKTNGGAEK